jgi:hypothetical protein
MWGVKRMETHEKHCTMNPNRICRVCKLLDQTPASLSGLIAICKKAVPVQDGWASEEFPGLHSDLMFAAGECPACELAAIRQSGLHPSMFTGFDFRGAMKDIFNEIDEAKIERDY